MKREAPRKLEEAAPRIGWSGTVLLQAVARGHAYGFELMDVTGLPSGTIYPLLRRLEARGLVRSRWESETAARGQGRPRRRYYEVTPLGEAALAVGVRAQRERWSTFGDLIEGAGGRRRSGS